MGLMIHNTVITNKFRFLEVPVTGIIGGSYTCTIVQAEFNKVVPVPAYR